MTAIDPLVRRERAIEASGWGGRFHFVQPHNACFWVYLAFVASGLWYVVTSVEATRGAFNEAYTTAIVTSGLFCAAFLLFLHWSDRWERTPPSLGARGVRRRRRGGAVRDRDRRQRRRSCRSTRRSSGRRGRPTGRRG